MLNGTRIAFIGSGVMGEAMIKGLLAQEIYRNVWPDVVEGRLRPEMARSFPLVEAAAAHRLMESGDFVGKIILLA